jgi:large subunit ribosomal protein L17
MANLVCSLIKHNRVRTTVPKAKEARRLADQMVTLAKKGTLHHRRQALAFLRQPTIVSKLFTELANRHASRQGGYTRIIRIGNRLGDAADMALLEWTGAPETATVTEQPAAPESK